MMTNKIHIDHHSLAENCFEKFVVGQHSLQWLQTGQYLNRRSLFQQHKFHNLLRHLELGMPTVVLGYFEGEAAADFRIHLSLQFLEF
jgi:hypothetical protein